MTFKNRVKKTLALMTLSISIGFSMPGFALAKPIAKPQNVTVVKTITLQQGNDAAFQLSDFFPKDVIDYQVQVLNDPHQVITAKVLNNVIYILVSPYDYKYAGISISPSYIIQVVAKRADNQLIVKQLRVNLKKQ